MGALAAFAIGVGMGVSIAAPVGPVAALCVERTIAGGAKRGVVSALGAGTPDGVFGALAAFGVAAVSTTLLAHLALLRAAGGVLLVVMGALAWKQRAAAPSDRARATTLASAYASTFALTLTNPITIVSFAAILATAGAIDESPVAITAGAFIGSAGWYAALVLLALRLRQRLVVRLALVRRVTAAILFAGGALALAQAATA